MSEAKWEPEDGSGIPSTFRWDPASAVLRHDGTPLDPGLVFFAPPPEAIGRVISADSSLKAGQRPQTLFSRLMLAGFIGSTVASGANFLFQTDNNLLMFAIFTPVAGLVFYFTRFIQQVSYVGVNGFARLKCQGLPDKISPAEQMLFADAKELHTSQSRNYERWAYNSTVYTYQWSNEKQQRVHRLVGTYLGEKKPPQGSDRFHFVSQCEKLWTLSLLVGLKKTISEGVAYRFSLGGESWVEVTPGLMIIRQKGETTEWVAEEIDLLTVANGTIKIKRRDAKQGWFSSTGVVSFETAELANAQLFLLCTSEFLGIPVTFSKYWSDYKTLDLVSDVES